MNSNNNCLPTARQLLQPSNYHLYNIIDETKTTPLPSFICTGDTYFYQKQLHLNAMLKKKGLLSLFIILSITESR